MTDDNNGVLLLSSTEAERKLQDYEREGWRVFRLPIGITSKKSFFEAVRGVMPLDPPIKSNRSWEALADSLWEGLMSLREKRIVVLWPSYGQMREKDPEAFAIASSIMRQLVSTLCAPEITSQSVKQVVVIQVT